LLHYSSFPPPQALHPLNPHNQEKKSLKNFKTRFRPTAFALKSLDISQSQHTAQGKYLPNETTIRVLAHLTARRESLNVLPNHFERIIHEKFSLPTQKEAVINTIQKDPVRAGSENIKTKTLLGHAHYLGPNVRGRSHKIVKGNEGNSVLGKTMN
jgi:predicted component of type VI protein secretion system